MAAPLATDPTISAWSQRLKQVKQTTPVVPDAPLALTDKEELDLLFEKYLTRVKANSGDAAIVVQVPASIDLVRAYQIATRFADYLNRSDPSIWAEAEEFGTTECETYEVRITAANKPRLVEKLIPHTQVPWRNDKPFEFYCNKGFLSAVEIPKGCGEFTLKYNGRDIAVSVGGKATLQVPDELTYYGQELANACIGDLHSKLALCNYSFKPTDLGILGSRVADPFSLHFHSATASSNDDSVTILLRVLTVTVPSSPLDQRTVRGCQDGL